MSTDAEIRAVRIEEKREHKGYRPPAPSPKHVVKPEKHGEVIDAIVEEYKKYKAFWEQARLNDKQVFEQYYEKEEE